MYGDTIWHKAVYKFEFVIVTAAYQSILLYSQILRQISVALLITHVSSFNSWLINVKKSTHLQFRQFFFCHLLYFCLFMSLFSNSYVYNLLKTPAV